ncbi:MAG: hypothetical protein QM831_39385 [Kofleriaceae bacterium]
MKRTVLLLALVACEHETPKPDPVKPDPVKPDPIKQAHDEFELLPQDQMAGTSKLLSRSDFGGDPFGEDAYDQGDFVGRLRTLFGEQPDNEYVLRHKRTGIVITAYAGDSGPSFGGVHRDDADARIAADKILSRDPFVDAQARLTAGAEGELAKRLVEYHQHYATATSVDGYPQVAAELERLLDAVTPSDWSDTFYYGDNEQVERVGVANGSSFERELEPEAGLAFLLDRTERATLDLRMSDDLDVLLYYEQHPVPALEPRVQAVLRRFVAADRDKLYAEDIRRWRKSLHVAK